MIELEPEQWRRAEILFLESEGLDPEERRCMLDRACAGDEALRSVVEELILQSLAESSFLDTPIARLGPPSPDGKTDPWIGQRFGAYRLIQRLGAGGMSLVFLAERADDEVDQQVAVKVLPSAEPCSLRARMLRREQRILARLHHPNIARFLDGGSTEEGQPYVVMEYIEGESMVTFCDRQRLDRRQRIALFIEVCAAVEYAHSQLVVHRDLKPGNILIDDNGVPKLLDFGIAKLLTQVVDEDPRTVTGERFLTPAYASPEQLAGQPVSTASDIYSLGVLLRDLLTSFLSEAKVAQSIEGAGPRSVLDRDLEAIIARCLQDRSKDRYPSVSRLAADLRCYLGGHPVSARVNGRWYRLSKFLRRNAVSASTSLLAGLALLMMTGIASVQSKRFRLERDAAEQAQREATELTGILLAGIQRANPYEQATSDTAESTTIRDVLDQLADSTQVGLDELPLARANVMHTLARVNGDLGRPHTALALFRKAFELRRDVLGWNDLRIARSLNGMALAHRDLGEFRQALVLHRSAAAIARQVSPGDCHPLASGLRGEALMLLEEGYIVEAAGLLEESLAIRRRLLGDNNRPVVVTASELGYYHYLSGDLQRAEAESRASLVALQRVLGDEHPDVATGIHYRALIVSELGQSGEAVRLQRRSLAMRRQLQGAEHPETLVNERELAGALLVAGQLDPAEDILRGFLKSHRKLGAEHQKTLARGTYLLGDLMRRREKLAEAHELLLEAVERYRELHGSETSKLIMPLARLGQVGRRLGHTDAGQRLDRALVLAQRRLGPTHYVTERVAELVVEGEAESVSPPKRFQPNG